jgi:predicted unusual protein kinase regulating ubiquinone biosynthesis (AarF/ABC1/UbiB family)
VLGWAGLRGRWRRPGGTTRRVATAAGAADGLRRLGGIYTKVGQFVAASPSVAGEDVAAEFRDCLDQAGVVPFRGVARAVEAELGRPVDQLFTTFDPVPTASGSLAVCHRATTADGAELMVKVLRPGIEQAVAADLRGLRVTLRIAARLGVQAAGSLLHFVNGLSRQLAEELDLRNEARAMAHFGAVFERAGLDLLEVPVVVDELSGRRVLTMSHLDGSAVDRLEDLTELGVDPRPLVEQLIRSWYHGLIGDGVFHGDIHAGNLLVLPAGRLAVLDWGIVAQLDPGTHTMYRRIIEGCLGDESAWVAVAEHVLALMPGASGDPAELAPGLRSQIEHTLLRPLGEGSLLAMSEPSAELGADPLWGAMAGGPAEDERSRWARWRDKRRAARTAIDDGAFESTFNHSNLLTLKTVVYLEHYGRTYLPEVALLSDEDFLRDLLA